MQGLLQKIKSNSTVYFRLVLFLTFFGHGLVNLGLSPSYGFHQKIASSFFPEGTNLIFVLHSLSVIDLLLAGLILLNIKPRIVLPTAVIYLLSVAFAVWLFYYNQSGSVFGFAEIMRRMPWAFFLIFLYISHRYQDLRFNLLRIGLSFAFLAHGTASLGILGLNKGHIELAGQIVPEYMVRDFVFYTGITDTILGLLLLTGIFSRIASYIGTIWLVFIVSVSFGFAIPDGLFRLGFLLSGLFIALDSRCHEQTIVSFILNRNK